MTDEHISSSAVKKFQESLSSTEQNLTQVLKDPYIGVKSKSSRLSTYFEFDFIIEYENAEFSISWFKNTSSPDMVSLVCKLARKIPGEIILMQTSVLETISIYIMGTALLYYKPSLYHPIFDSEDGVSKEIDKMKCGILYGTSNKTISARKLKTYSALKLSNYCQNLIKI